MTRLGGKEVLDTTDDYEEDDAASDAAPDFQRMVAWEATAVVAVVVLLVELFPFALIKATLLFSTYT